MQQLQQEQMADPVKSHGSALGELQKEATLMNGTKTTRTVTLKYLLGCACRMNEYSIVREVPENSPLKDGDIISNLEAGDVTPKDQVFHCPGQLVTMLLGGHIGAGAKYDLQ